MVPYCLSQMLLSPRCSYSTQGAEFTSYRSEHIGHRFGKTLEPAAPAAAHVSRGTAACSRPFCAAISSRNLPEGITRLHSTRRLQTKSLTAGQKLLAAKPPSPLIPTASSESPQLKVTSPGRKIPALYAEAAGAGQEMLQPAPVLELLLHLQLWELRSSGGTC